jgi:hypothetical protein
LNGEITREEEANEREFMYGKTHQSLVNGDDMGKKNDKKICS